MEAETQNLNCKHVLPPELCIKIYKCIIEELLDELFILKSIGNCPINKIIETNKTSQTSEQYKSNLITFTKHFEFLERALKTVYKEIENKGTYENLVEIINNLNKSKTKAILLKEEVVRKQTELRKLQDTLIEEEQYFHTEIAEYMANIGKIKDEIEDFMVESEIKLDYIEKWQNSKKEMNEILVDRQEQEKMTELRKLDSDIYKEARVNQEILAAYRQMEKDIQADIDKWEEKYKEDYENLGEKIEAIEDKRKIQSEATKALTETYEKREKEIHDYKLYKEKQEEKKLELQKKNEAATKIQAWWRGTMVRKGFGKYRKKKEKKGKKKGSEKLQKK